MTDRLTTIRRRWADFPRLRFIGDRPRKHELDPECILSKRVTSDGGEIITRDRFSTTMADHYHAGPVLRDLLYRWSKAPEDVRWLVREVERLRGRVANLEAAALLLDEARSHAVRERDTARQEAGSTEPVDGMPRWVVRTEDGDLDGYVWANSRAAALSAAHRMGADGDFIVMEDVDDD